MQEYGKLANKIYIETSKDGGPFYDLMGRDFYREGQEIGTRSQRNILNIMIQVFKTRQTFVVTFKITSHI